MNHRLGQTRFEPLDDGENRFCALIEKSTGKFIGWCGLGN
jgi:hypothetical protein